MAKNNYYVVWKGRQRGVFDSWEKCKEQIEGFKGAAYRGFPSRDMAEQAFKDPKSVSTQEAPDPGKVGRPIIESMAVDAACSGNPGKMEYRGVYTKTGEQIFHQGPFLNGTNNIGEFLALVHALALLKQRNSTMPIYSDSVTAMKWVRDKKAATKLEPDARNKALFDMITRAEKWLKENTYPNKIIKWETTVWGEIPADFGRK